MSKIFISYSRSDVNTVSKIIDRLKTAGHEVWVDRIGIRGGEKWRQEIVHAIEESDVIALVLSKNSIASDNVRKEIDLAEGSKIQIIPLLLQQVDIPASIKYQLAGIQQIDLYTSFERGLQDLLDAIGEEQRAAPARIEKRKPFRPFDGWHPSNRAVYLSLAGIVVLGGILGAFLFKGNIFPPSIPQTPKPYPPPADIASAPFTIAPSSPTPTHTLTPSLEPTTTHTPSPTPTSGPMLREGEILKAGYLASPPQIDGRLDEWKLPRVPVTALVFGEDNHSGPADLSAELMLGWDEGYLYIALDIRDDRYVQNATGDKLFQGDYIDILLDTELEADFSDDKLSDDDFQIGLSLGSDLRTPENSLWYPVARRGEKTGLRLAGLPTLRGYTTEAAISWKIFLLAPLSGGIYGFALSIGDDDLVDINRLETMVSTAPNRRLTNPTTWGNLSLEKAP